MPAFTENDLDAFLDAFGTDVVLKRNGVTVDTVCGVLRHNVEFVGQGGELIVLPAIKVKPSTAAGISHSHTLHVGGRSYRMFGEPVPSDSGFHRIGLVKA